MSKNKNKSQIVHVLEEVKVFDELDIEHWALLLSDVIMKWLITSQKYKIEARNRTESIAPLNVKISYVYNHDSFLKKMRRGMCAWG